MAAWIQDHPVYSQQRVENGHGGKPAVCWLAFSALR